METIIQRLKDKAKIAPNNTLLRDTLSLLVDLEQNPRTACVISWDALQRDFDQLRERGLWERSEESDRLLNALRDFLAINASQGPHATSDTPDPKLGAESRFSIVVPSSKRFTSQLVPNTDVLVLPLELVSILDETFFLHLLAVNPEQVLPPGKSLLSVMSRSRATPKADTKPTLQSQVEALVHRAFWDEAGETLSKSDTAAQLARLKLLYEDIHVALTGLLFPKDPVLVTLSSSLSPASSPLESAVPLLRGVLARMRERCAPVRDPEIESAQRALEEPPIRTSRPLALAKLVADTTKFILSFSKVMKKDLAQVTLGSMTEQQLASVVTKQARAREREVTLDLWRLDRILQGWHAWLKQLRPPFPVSGDGAEPRFSWIVRLVQSLGSPLPVSCPVPTKAIRTDHGSPGGSEKEILPTSATSASTDDGEVLPPVFFFSVPTLVKFQNLLQALVITAALRTLIPPPLPAKGAQAGTPDPTPFTERVWTLLQADISGEPEVGSINLVNLADEVVHARRQDKPSLSKEEEAMVHSAVDWTLKPTNPVFVLLQNRLLRALVTVLVQVRMESYTNGHRGVVPETLRSGRGGEGVDKRPRLALEMDEQPRTSPVSGVRMPVMVKGFEDPVLHRAIERLFVQVERQVAWVESVWGDVVETGSGRNDNGSSGR